MSWFAGGTEHGEAAGQNAGYALVENFALTNNHTHHTHLTLCFVLINFCFVALTEERQTPVRGFCFAEGGGCICGTRSLIKYSLSHSNAGKQH